MEGGTIPTNITLYLMLGICIVLLTVNLIEITKITKVWSNRSQFNPVFFENCIKIDILIKTVFTAFSLLASISAIVFIAQMLLFMQTFINKFLNSFLHLNYLVFGLYMLAFCIFGIVKWNDVAYTCDKKLPFVKVLAVGNVFSLVGCCVLSIVIVFGTSIYSVITLYTDSLLRREGGSSILRTVFWWVVLCGRNNDNIRNLGNNEINNNHIEHNILAHIDNNQIPDQHQENNNVANANDNDNEEAILLNQEHNQQ